jgi:hypothetical protein
MITSILSILAYLIPFVLEAWKANSPERKLEAANAAIQQGRTDLESGNTDAVVARIDSVCAGLSSSTTGQQSAEDIARRISAL